MNDVEVERQIDQMVKFIKQEAKEKANEINVSAEEEFNIEKLQIVENEKRKVKQDFERREAFVEVKRKVNNSKQLNKSRISLLQTRENALQGIIKEVEQKLLQISKNRSKYCQLLRDLIVQGLVNLNEDNIIIKGRENDYDLLLEAMDEAKTLYSHKFNREAPVINISEDFLPNTSDSKNSLGGVVLMNSSRTIICSQKLEDRLELAYKQNLPIIRNLLF